MMEGYKKIITIVIIISNRIVAVLKRREQIDLAYETACSPIHIEDKANARREEVLDQACSRCTTRL